LGTGGGLSVDGSGNPNAAATGGAASGTEDYSLADAQRKLTQLGLYSSKVDGVSGPGTIRAISTFQKANGLQVNGQLDAATISALQAR
jgi:peptidoglycan hydrolase-like protein with peptidoglycan-binding domain